MLKIKELRNEKNVSQQKLADYLGVSRSTVAMWETGNSEPDNEMLITIANYFDVSVDYLLGKTEQKKPLVNNDEELTEYLEELKNREELRMLFSVSSKATKEDVMQAVKIIEALRNTDN